MASSSKYLASLLFPLLSAFAGYAIFAFSRQNGAFDLVEEVISKNPMLGSSGEPLRTTYVGIEPIDHLLTTLTTFFWPVVDGSNPSLLLHSATFVGAFGSAWVLIVLESWRAGNSGKIFSFSSIFGNGAQLMTYAVSVPLFLGLQLLTSNVSFNPTARNLAVSTAVVNAIPAVFILAYVVPTFSMLLPAPGTVTFDQKQILIALWQPWPAYVSLLLTLVSVTSSSSRSSESPSKLRKSLRSVYTFALSHAALNHIIAWSISLATVINPVMFSPEYRQSLHPSEVFTPRLPFLSADFRVKSVGEGVHIFLQWDFLIGSSAVLLWAVIVNVLAHRKIEGEVGWFNFACKVAISLALTGPIGTAVRLVWERDELVLEEEMMKDAARKVV